MGPRAKNALPVAFIVACALAALVTGFSISVKEPDGDTERASDRDEGSLQERVRSALGDGGGAVESSPSTFLTDLKLAEESSSARSGEEGVACVGWESDEEVPAAATELLDAYVQEGGYELMTSGYLDLKGDVWGALLEGKGAYADIVAVSSEKDGGSRTRVVRLVSDAIDGAL